MKAEDFLKAGNVDDALKKLQDEVRAKPADAKLRVFLFQLLCVMGDWPRALTQLDVSAQLDAKNLLMAQVCHAAIQAENFREEVFAGERAPLVFGEPEEWIAWLIQANQLTAKGNFAAAAELRSKALEVAPAISGSVTTGTNEEGKGTEQVTPFDWIADADERLGPVLEAFLEGKYYWIPFSRIKSVKIEAPADLRDSIWIFAQFTWTTGTTSIGLIPVRYPDSQKNPDGHIRISRKTDWKSPAPDVFLGQGQRLFTTGENDFALLDCRTITLNHPE
jgi:type VI secretion system protein ImpE